MEVRKVGYENVIKDAKEFTIVQFNLLGYSHHYLYKLKNILGLEQIYNVDNSSLVCYFRVKLDGGYNKTKN